MLEALRARDVFLVAGLRGDRFAVSRLRHAAVGRGARARRSACARVATGAPMRRVGLALVLIGAIAAIAAPALAPHATDARFPNLLNAPPTRPHLIDDAGRLARALHLSVDARRSPGAALRAGPQPARFRSSGSAAAAWSHRRTPVATPLLLLGADSYGRDVFSRLRVRRARVAGAVGRWRRSARCSSGGLVGRARRLRRRHGRRSADAGDRLRDGPAGDVRRARAAGGAAAGARRRSTVFVFLGRHLRRRRRAVRLARRPRHRPHASGGSSTPWPRRRSARGTPGCSAAICCRPRAASWPSR